MSSLKGVFICCCARPPASLSVSPPVACFGERKAHPPEEFSVVHQGEISKFKEKKKLKKTEENIIF
jgi:hypothetical protein